MNEFIIQGIGGLGILASVIAFQCKKHNQILFFRALNEFIFAVQYVLLGAYTGAAMDLIGVFRNIVFTKRAEKNKSTKPYIIFFSIIFAVFGILTTQGAKSILVISAKVLSTVAYGNTNPTTVRIIILITSTCWLIYNIYVFSLAGILCEVFTILSILTAFIRINLLKK